MVQSESMKQQNKRLKVISSLIDDITLNRKREQRRDSTIVPNEKSENEHEETSKNNSSKDALIVFQCVKLFFQEEEII